VQGVFHSGGVLADATIPNQTLAGIRAAAAPKTSSAQLWQGVLGAQPATMHIVFSSVAALLGSPGQANYSAANAALDGIAQAWQSRGLAGTSVQWGAWAEGGMAQATAATARAVERMGMGMVAPAAGIGAVQTLLLQRLAATRAITAAVPFKWGAFMARLHSAPPMFAAFSSLKTAAGTDSADSSFMATPTEPATKLAPIAATPKQEKNIPRPVAIAAVDKEAVLSQVQEAIVSVLGTTVDVEAPLMSAGLDSLGSVELKNALERRAGLELPSTLVFDYPTASALAGFLAGKLAGAGPDAPEDAVLEDLSLGAFFYGGNVEAGDLHSAGPASRLVGVSELVSRSCGNALLSPALSDKPGPVPLERWDVETQADLCGGLPVQFGVFLEGVAAFDPIAVGVSETEAALMDPQQRLLLESVAEAMLARPAEAADEAVRAGWGVFVVGRCTFFTFFFFFFVGRSLERHICLCLKSSCIPTSVFANLPLRACPPTTTPSWLPRSFAGSPPTQQQAPLSAWCQVACPTPCVSRALPSR
jgi:acyl carrier protein